MQFDRLAVRLADAITAVDSDSRILRSANLSREKTRIHAWCLLDSCKDCGCDGDCRCDYECSKDCSCNNECSSDCPDIHNCEMT
jgi:hypothetical protein